MRPSFIWSTRAQSDCAARSAAHVSTLNLPHHVTTLWCQRPGSRGDTAERDPSRRRAYARGHLDATQRHRTALRLADKGHLTAAAPRFSPANSTWAGRGGSLSIAVPLARRENYDTATIE